MLFIIPDKFAVFTAQSDHINVLVLLFVVKGVDKIVLAALCKPPDNLADFVV